ncbi:unnamed protein product [Scytosiphon promiscuus]
MQVQNPVVTRHPDIIPVEIGIVHPSRVLMYRFHGSAREDLLFLPFVITVTAQGARSPERRVSTLLLRTMSFGETAPSAWTETERRFLGIRILESAPTHFLGEMLVWSE